MIEKGFERNALTFCLEAVVKLPVAFGCRVIGIKSADAVKEVSAFFTKFISKGKPDISPIAVSGGNIYLLFFNLLNDGFYLCE